MLLRSSTRTGYLGVPLTLNPAGTISPAASVTTRVPSLYAEIAESRSNPNGLGNLGTSSLLFLKAIPRSHAVELMEIRMFKKLLLTALLISLAPLARANEVQNPGFELGPADWTFSGWFIAGPGHTGTWAAGTGCVGHGAVVPGSGCYISQNLTTVPDQT